ncbi:MAG TPA: transposase [candidate division Zixibacteria bacterium]
MLHRNSQKRFYVENSVYFITTKTYDSFPYFDEEILCNLLIDSLKYSQKKKSFKIFGYKINPDHIHLLIQSNNEHNYSKIMHNVKRNFSHNANIVLGVHEVDCEIKGDDIASKGECGVKGDDYGINKGDDNYRRLCGHGYANYKKLWNYDILVKYKNRLDDKFHNNHPYPKFRWQKSFHYHIIVDARDVLNHVKYIKNQYIKHHLNGNAHCFINDELIQEVV